MDRLPGEKSRTGRSDRRWRVGVTAAGCDHEIRQYPPSPNLSPWGRGVRPGWTACPGRGVEPGGATAVGGLVSRPLVATTR